MSESYKATRCESSAGPENKTQSGRSMTKDAITAENVESIEVRESIRQ